MSAVRPVPQATRPPCHDLALHDPRLLTLPPEALLAGLGSVPLAQLRLGSEFCERLLPATADLERLLAVADGLGVAAALVTPMVGDAGLAQLQRLLARLPAGSEVIVNDWGVLQRVADGFGALRPVAGRLLCKMVKDPRLESPVWARLYPGHAGSAALVALLRRFAVTRLEMDVPPFARAGDLEVEGLELGVHAEVGFAAKGRVCQIGSLHQPTARKFAPGHGCRHECLDYLQPMRRDSAHGRELPTAHWGNTLLYAHDDGMRAALAGAAADGRVARVIHGTLAL